MQDKAAILESYGPDAGPMVRLARRIGPAAMDAVLEELGGERPALPEPDAFWRGLWRRMRDEQIRAQFRGNNLAELAQRHGLCERHVRRIVCHG